MQTSGTPACEPSPGGNVVIYARVHNRESKRQMEGLLADLVGDRISTSLFEISTADWDPGLWEETVAQMQLFIDPERDTLVFWQSINGVLTRTSIAGRFA